MIRVFPAIIELGLLVFCLIEAIQAPENEIRNLPRWGWILLIIIIPLVGGIAWLVAGRPLRSSTAGLPYRGNGGRATGSGAGPAAYPSGRAGGRPAPRGPDDDVEFLAGLRRADSEHEDVLRKWEEDLKRREEQLKGEPPADGTGTDDPDASPPPTR